MTEVELEIYLGQKSKTVEEQSMFDFYWCRDALSMIDFGLWQICQHLGFMEKLGVGFAAEPPDDGGWANYESLAVSSVPDRLF